MASKDKKQGNGDEKKKNISSKIGWEDLDRDALLIIFQKLGIKDLSTGAPLCCTSWYKASKDPSLWEDVDLRLLTHYKGKPIHPTRLIESIVARSHGSLTSIKFPFAASVSDLLLVAERCSELKYFYLRVPLHILHDQKEKIVTTMGKLRKLEGMDIQSRFISDEYTLEQIGKCCPYLLELKVYGQLSKDNTLLIPTLFPKLKLLSLSKIHKQTLLDLLKGCNDLEHLSASVCRKIRSDDEIIRIAHRCVKEFKWDDKILGSCQECSDAGW